MNPKEKFDIIINEIERLVQGEEDQNGDITYYGKQEICEIAFHKAQCYISTAREKNALFQFLMNKNVYEYITERKLMTAYECLLEMGMGEGYEKAMEIVGSANQSGFIKQFKSRFLVTPDKAVKEKDYTLLLPRPSWEKVSGEDWFRLEVVRLKEHYKLNDRECAFAIDIHEKYKLKLSAVFEYVYNYVWGYIEGIEGLNGERDADIEYYLGDKNVLKMYFEYRFSMDMIFGVLLAKELKMICRDIDQCGKMYLEGCVNVVFDAIADQMEYKGKRKSPEEIDAFYSFYEENYQYYMENANKKYTCYDYILYSLTSYHYGKERAFALLTPGISDYGSLIKENTKVRISVEMMEQSMREVEEEMYQELKREAKEEEMKEFYGEIEAEDHEDYQLASLEMNPYNPDFGQEGYMSNYDDVDDFDYDYEPDFDELEWREGQYLMKSEEEPSSFCDLITVGSEDILVGGREECMLEHSENMDFEELCEEFARNEKKARLSRHSNLNVREYLDKQMMEEDIEFC